MELYIDTLGGLLRRTNASRYAVMLARASWMTSASSRQCTTGAVLLLLDVGRLRVHVMRACKVACRPPGRPAGAACPYRVRLPSQPAWLGRRTTFQHPARCPLQYLVIGGVALFVSLQTQCLSLYVRRLSSPDLVLLPVAVFLDVLSVFGDR